MPDRELAIVIRARDAASGTLKQVQQNAARTSGVLAGMSARGTGAAGRMTTAFHGVAERVRSLGQRISSAGSAFGGLASAAGGAAMSIIGAFGGVASTVIGIVSRIGIVGAGAFVAVGAAAAAAVVKAQHYAESVDRIAKTSGVSREALQRLGFAAEQEFGSMEELGGAMNRLSRSMQAAQGGAQKFNRAMAEGKADPELQGAAEAFQKLGIAVTDARGKLRPLQSVMLDISERFRAMPAGAERTALAMQLFGRGGASLIPFLAQGRREITDLGRQAERLGLVLSTKSVIALESFGDEVSKVQAGIKGMALQIGVALLPAAQQISKAFQEANSVILDFVKRNRNAIGAWATHAATKAKEIGISLSVFIGGALRRLINYVTQNRAEITGMFSAMAVSLSVAAQRVREIILTLVDWIKKNLTLVKQTIALIAIFSLLRVFIAAAAGAVRLIALALNLVGKKTLLWGAIIADVMLQLLMLKNVWEALQAGEPIDLNKAYRDAFRELGHTIAGMALHTKNAVTKIFKEAFPEFFDSIDDLGGRIRASMEGGLRDFASMNILKDILGPFGATRGGETTRGGQGGIGRGGIDRGGRGGGVGGARVPNTFNVPMTGAGGVQWVYDARAGRWRALNAAPEDQARLERARREQEAAIERARGERKTRGRGGARAPSAFPSPFRQPPGPGLEEREREQGTIEDFGGDEGEMRFDELTGEWYPYPSRKRDIPLINLPPQSARRRHTRRSRQGAMMFQRQGSRISAVFETGFITARQMHQVVAQLIRDMSGAGYA